ncbi:ABC transporter ATP-binding protein [Merismopedia glauca]|uniref:Multidrug ABC transporter ATP-binding protein n=1 Tax=Merismopedia glauca CCAP 1448/3 TaxID=1296344 RepID=A0A2T1C8Y6_9CYAN|nr:ABC transporter ATP-binding protein [Merismopedia glauca]PSB04709.1 multidrug ABC transporter ATP-binding protein [Merismopedia glauca CCAP 1448/3]
MNKFNLDRPETQVAVQTYDLRKVYRTGFWLNQKIESLKGCSLTVYPQETFGLLGPNGAGKTTLLKTLLGIVRPTSGVGLLLGYPIGNQAVKQKIGYLPENIYLYDYLTGWEFLEFAAGLFEIHPNIYRKRIPQLLELVGLSVATAKKKQLRQYSKGMLQRIGMAQALINDPELVFLDEPMSGLDPVGRKQMREVILSLKAAGKTVFFNSHVLAEVEQICDRIAILSEGELICIGALNDLLAANDSNYQVRGTGGDPQELRRWIPNLVMEDNIWHGQLQGETDVFIANLRELGGQLIDLHLGRPNLEDFFMEQLRQHRS